MLWAIHGPVVRRHPTLSFRGSPVNRDNVLGRCGPLRGVRAGHWHYSTKRNTTAKSRSDAKAVARGCAAAVRSTSVIRN